RAAFDKDALRDVVAAAGVGEQLVEQVAMPIAVPQMMVRIDDLERRLQDLLLPLCPPRRITVARSGRRAAGHGYGSGGGGSWLVPRRGGAQGGPPHPPPPFRPASCAAIPNEGEPSSQSSPSSKLFRVRTSRSCS